MDFQNETVIKLNTISTSVNQIEEMNKRLSENIQKGSGNSDMKFTLMNEKLEKKFEEYESQFESSSDRITKLEE